MACLNMTPSTNPFRCEFETHLLSPIINGIKNVLGGKFLYPLLVSTWKAFLRHSPVPLRLIVLSGDGWLKAVGTPK